MKNPFVRILRLGAAKRELLEEERIKGIPTVHFTLMQAFRNILFRGFSDGMNNNKSHVEFIG